MMPHRAIYQDANVTNGIRFSVVVPVYNEQEVLQVTYLRLKAVMDDLAQPYELIFVNDGSKDDSQNILAALCKRDAHVKVLGFSRNFGHQVAITAGTEHASGDAVIIIDADLQDPPELIPELVARWQQGYEVVYAKRVMRKGESWFKRWTAGAFYRTLRLLTDVDIPVSVGDFRLFDRKVSDVLMKIHEKNRFVRGIVAWTGFRQSAVEYVREARYAGETKYPLRKMLRLSSDAITSFSEKLPKFPLYIGGLMVALSLVGMTLLMVLGAVTGHMVSAVWFLMTSGAFLNGLVLMALGVLGQYVTRILDEARDRPLYVVADQIGFGSDENHANA